MTPNGFSELAKLIPTPLLLLDGDGRVLRASTGAGSEPPWRNRAEEHPLTDLVEEPSQEVTAYLRACRRSAQPLVGALTFRTLDESTPGVRCRCYGAGIASASGKGRFIVLRLIMPQSGERDSFATLTERISLLDSVRRGKHSAAVDIEERERRLDYLLETTQDAVVFIDPAQNITRFNASAEHLFGYARDEALGRSLTMLLPPQHRARHARYIARYLETGERHAIGKIRELLALHKDGSEIPIEISVTPLDPEGRGPFGAFIRDTSERRKLQAQVMEKERLAAVGTTAAMFAHEVANPLNGMSMNAQLLSRRLHKAGVEDKGIANNVAMIAQEIKRLAGLLDDFRGLSKRQQFHLAPARLHDLLAHLLEEHGALYRAQKIEVRTEFPDSIPKVRIDQSKFKQALLNLCKNAVEAMPEGGTLTIRLSSRDAMVRIEIEDTGVGIPTDIDVFEPFKTTKHGGTGLGLPIVRRMMEAHQGTIGYEATAGHGTTFVLELPAVESEPAPT